MDERFIRERITALRMQKGISEYQMSYDLGHSRGYINNITSGKALPSMGEFLAICDYFSISPQRFFDERQAEPQRLDRTARLLDGLSPEDLRLVECLVDRLYKK